MSRFILGISVVMIFVLSNHVYSQAELLYTNDFETYVDGEQVACENEDWWTTWSDDPCSSEDPFITDEEANSGTLSIVVEGSNNAVLLLGDKTEGRFEIRFNFYVPTGNYGYFNLLQGFAGANSVWGMQTFLAADGAGKVNANIWNAAIFTYSYDEWNSVKLIIDLNADLADMYVNDEFVVNWQWSLGIFGEQGPLQLSAMSLYAWDNNGTPKTYYDDIVFEQFEDLVAPTNLVAIVVDDNDVELTWDAIEGKDIIGYNVYRGLEKIADGITELFYTDDDLLPNNYTYNVRGKYDEGISPGAGEVEVTIEGGTERDLVLFEIFTGTWCQYCPGAAMGADDMVEEGHQVAIIEYHLGDDFDSDETNARDTYYDVIGYPTTHADGVLKCGFGNATVSLYETYLGYYEQRIDVPSLFTLSAIGGNSGVNTWQISVDAEMIYDYPFLDNDIVLQAVLTESAIPENWQGLTELNFVCRDMIPDENGTALDFAENAIQNLTIDVEIPPEYLIGNCQIVVFIQDLTTMEIMQTTIAQLAVGVDKQTFTRQLSIYPNPASGMVNIESGIVMENLMIYNHFGQVAFEQKVEEYNFQLSTSQFVKGLYLLQIETAEGIALKKLIIERFRSHE